MPLPLVSTNSALRNLVLRLHWPTLIVVPVILALFGCSGARHGGATEVVYWTGWSAHELVAQQKLVDEFNRTHPAIRVRMVSQFSESDSYEKVRIAFAGSATPDIMSTIWDAELAPYALRGVLTPLDSYLAASNRSVALEYTPGVARMLRIGGHIYGLTVTTDTNFIVYNRSLFKSAGLDPDHPPTSTTQLDAAARACTKTDSQGRLLQYGFVPSGLNLWAYVFGGRWVDSHTGAITANDPHNVAALRWMASYAKMFDLKRVQAFQDTFGGNATASGPFFTGRMAMWATGEWSGEFIRRYAPNLKWGWFALPFPPRGRANTTRASGSIFVIPQACKHKPEAWTFLNWISSPHAVTQFCIALNNVPPLTASGKDPAFQRDPLLKFAVGLANGPNAFGPPAVPIWTTYNREIGRAEESAMLGGADPQHALDDLQSRMQLELNRTLDDLRQ